METYYESVVDAATGEETIRQYVKEDVFVAPPKYVQEAARRSAYVEEADPLFFMAQRGEATLAEWQAKVAEIKARFPYPAE